MLQQPPLFLSLTQVVDCRRLTVGSRYDGRMVTEDGMAGLVSAYCLRLYRSGLRLRLPIELIREVEHEKETVTSSESSAAGRRLTDSASVGTLTVSPTDARIDRHR